MSSQLISYKRRKLFIQLFGSVDAQGECCYCKKPLKFEESTIEHVRPRALGGTDAYRNLAICCKQCNHEKGTKLSDTLNKLYAPDGKTKHNFPKNRSQIVDEVERCLSGL